MVEIDKKDIDLGQICDSGQCFRMRRMDGASGAEESDIPGRRSGDGESDQEDTADESTYEIIALDKRLTARQTADRLYLECSNEEYEDLWKEYLDMDTDYSAIKALVDDKDKYLKKAVETGNGLRILKQDLWEMIVTFLISQQNNIPRIHKCIDNICREYGEYVGYAEGTGSGSCDGREKTTPTGLQEGAGSSGFYGFPTPDKLSTLDEDALMPCNLGYRSKYVVRAARAVSEGSLDLEAIKKMDYPEARETLLKVYGIGNKVADCVCLFGLHHLEAFPVDTHIKQVLQREYGAEEGFDHNRYHKYLGVIQQYMFYNEIV
ncbi:MAG: 8-oxoguanine DNA glycosylase [Lachnospiraceae bacterium]|nr:8-oxoguanine DNA glycosylase [Lachnospiraceae bacterium]